ncbi:MAG: hypothetical protein WCA77_07920, partial [Thermoplasmata archaeon]
MRIPVISKVVVIVVLLLLTGFTVPLLVGPRSNAPNPSPLGQRSNPAVINPSAGWAGISYNQTCGACVLADVQLASSAEDVLEMVNGSYAIWAPSGTVITSGTLDSLFGTGSDILADPQVRFDTTSQRWFIS